MTGPGRVRVGISGWRYPPWRGVFYPEGLAQRLELEYAAARLSTIEINGSFYALQRPSSWVAWHDQTPEDFVFAVKGPRFVTHMKKLRDVRDPIANFFASGVLALRDKLGPVLWQLPPTLGFHPDVLETFLCTLPADTDEARDLARRHDERMTDRTWLTPTPNRQLRHALEVRHASFATAELVELLRAHGVALVVADTAGKWPLLEHTTADIAYYRLHGDQELYTSGYSPEALDAWAAKVLRDARAGRDVYVYFDNDAKVHAPFDAMAMAQRVEHVDAAQ